MLRNQGLAWWSHIILPVFAGGLVYVLWRNDSLIMFQWFETLRLDEHVASWRSVVGPWSKSLPTWLLFSFPHGCWSYAFVVCIGTLWQSGPKFSRIAWLGCVLALAVGSELGQWLQVVPGTFSGIDLLFNIGAALLAL